ncbi:MAG: FG-GAP repeat protein, partial [Steroidobacteraceae bacterium]|nr:FG-GAP repeat protein [Steroidobacteraceae bacterium]
MHLKTEAGDVGLVLAGVGRAGKLVSPASAVAEVDGARVLYRHGASLTQWFINSPLGLEQGFTLEQRPEGQGELQLALALTGDLTPTLDRGELIFTSQSSGTELRYGALSAFDAEGTALPARMELEGARLVLTVDDSNAEYPVIVDPLFTQLGKLTAADGAPNDQFGYSVALSGDGDTAVIGAPYAGFDGKPQAGAAYVFTRNGASWSQQAKLIAADAMSFDHFGSSIALSSDGDTALIGAPEANLSGTNDAGAAYVFTRNGVSWSQQAKLTAAPFATNEKFGRSVALSGGTALVGAPGVGLTYVFGRDGASWSQEKILTGDDGTDGFGYSVSLSGDTALIGAYQSSPDGKSGAGAAYVFVRDGGFWNKLPKLTATDGAPNDNFGHSVSVSGNNTVLIGAAFADPNAKVDAGAAYIFTRSGAVWSQRAKLTAADRMP